MRGVRRRQRVRGRHHREPGEAAPRGVTAGPGGLLPQGSPVLDVGPFRYHILYFTGSAGLYEQVVQVLRGSGSRWRLVDDDGSSAKLVGDGAAELIVSLRTDRPDGTKREHPLVQLELEYLH